MITKEQIANVLNHPVHDGDGNKIGEAKHVYLDDVTGLPEFVTVKTGLFGTHETFVPTREASVVRDHIQVPYRKDKVKGAPHIDVDAGGHLSETEEHRLYDYYGLDWNDARRGRMTPGTAGTSGTDTTTTGTGTGTGMGTGSGTAATSGRTPAAGTGRTAAGGAAAGAGAGAGGAGAAGAAARARASERTTEHTAERTTGRTGERAGGWTGERAAERGERGGQWSGERSRTGAGMGTGTGMGRDDAMTRSEERLHIGVESREVGRARLRKYVVTEEVEQTVPLRHDEVRVEREPITDANRDAALIGPEIGEAEYEVVLHEERPVVETETVPVERVRLTTEEHISEETVRARLRKEHIKGETEGFDETTRDAGDTGDTGDIGSRRGRGDRDDRGDMGRGRRL
ncbi:PRC and DUF2382 domain-containing protein [Streptomyces sp. NPDC085995]|uniref:PRC and DUF2382 domain-containing protein n=1 Tax=Streptomyces sp. NPDC085995 TaxID=3154861 RepID=UPI003431A791